MGNLDLHLKTADMKPFEDGNSDFLKNENGLRPDFYAGGTLIL